MESQINRLETRIEKMQERFNKDLEEIKKSPAVESHSRSRRVCSEKCCGPQSCPEKWNLFPRVLKDGEYTLRI